MAPFQGERGPKGEQGKQGDQGNQGNRGDSNGIYPDDMPTWLKILFVALQKFGVATIILFVGGYWLCSRVVEPLITTYTEFIHTQGRAATEQADALKAIKESEKERIIRIKDMEAKSRIFEERVEKEHEAMLSNLTQSLADHRLFMERLEKASLSSRPPAN